MDTIIDMVQQQVSFAAVVVMISLCASPTAQSPAPDATKPSFEVASVKPNKSAYRGMSAAEEPGGRFVAINVTLAMLVRNAFGLQEAQLVGLPDWGASERFDIIAKAEQAFPTTNEKP